VWSRSGDSGRVVGYLESIQMRRCVLERAFWTVSQTWQPIAE